MQIYDLVLHDRSPFMIIAIHPSGHCRLWPNPTGLSKMIPLGELAPVPDDRIIALKRLFTRDLLDRRCAVVNQLQEIDRRLAALQICDIKDQPCVPPYSKHLPYADAF